MNNLLQYKNQIIAAVIVFVFFFIAKGMIADYSSKTKALDQKRSELLQQKRAVERYDSVSSEYDSLIEKFARSDSRPLRLRVDELARKYNITINKSAPAREDKQIYIEVGVNLALAGSYKGLAQFLSSVEDAGMFIDNIKISYDPAQGDPDNGVQPGTAFEDLPEDWVCPECGVDKSEFSPQE